LRLLVDVVRRCGRAGRPVAVVGRTGVVVRLVDALGLPPFPTFGATASAIRALGV
jgi:hypothetical protein